VEPNTIESVIVQVYQQHGIFAFLGLMVILLTLFAAYEVIKAIGSKIIDKRFKWWKKDEKFDLSAHSVFQKMDSMINHQIPNMQMDCPLRDKIFKKLLTIRAKTLKKNLQEMAKKQWSVSSEDMRVAWDSFFARVEYEWTNEAKVSGIPIIAIQRFIANNEGVSKVVTDLVSNLCTSGRMYDHNEEKIETIFEVLGSMEVSSIFSATDTLDSLNGEISNLTFEGEQCHHCQAKCPVTAPTTKVMGFLES